MVGPQAICPTLPVPIVIQDTKGRLVTTSKNVAEVTGKEHRNVTRDIDQLLANLAETCRSDLSNLYSQEVTACDPAANRETRSFEMTRDGMALLVMGYTTPRAMEFKLVSCGSTAHYQTMSADTPKPSSEVIEPYRLPRRVRAAVGEIIMVGAEVDHLISMSLFKAAEIKPWIGFVLLKRAPISQKLETLGHLIEEEANEQRLKEWDALSPDIRQFSENRNVLSHGIYRGRLKATGKLSFGMPQAYVATDGKHPYYYENRLITEEAIAITATKGHEICERLKRAFEVLPFHETYSDLHQIGRPESLKAKRKQANRQKKPR